MQSSKKPELIGPITFEGKQGYLNWNGEWAIPPRFDWLGEVSEGMVGFQTGNKLGFLGLTGEVVIEPRFELGPRAHLPAFHEGLAAVWERDGAGYINTKGEWAIPWQPNAVTLDFSDGKAIQILEGHYVIDAAGQRLSTLPVYEVPWNPDWPKRWDWMVCLVEGAGLAVQPFNWRGDVILETRFAALGDLHQDVAPFSVDDDLYGPFGVVSKTGQVVKRPAYKSILAYGDGLAPASLTKRKKKSGYTDWGYIDINGEFVVEPKYHDTEPFHHGFACVTEKLNKGQSFSFLNPKGEPAFGPMLRRPRETFRDGRAMIATENTAQIIDTSFNVIWECPLSCYPDWRLWG